MVFLRGCPLNGDSYTSCSCSSWNTWLLRLLWEVKREHSQLFLIGWCAVTWAQPPAKEAGKCTQEGENGMGFSQHVAWPPVYQDHLFISLGLLLFDNLTHGLPCKSKLLYEFKHEFSSII